MGHLLQYCNFFFKFAANYGLYISHETDTTYHSLFVL